MTYTMQVKPTWYAGIQFRSRLEARWAVFFDALGIPWSYEPETFVTENGHEYTPDFQLHLDWSTRHSDCRTDAFYAEVKPTVDGVRRIWPKVYDLIEGNGPLGGGITFLGEVPDARAFDWTPAHPYAIWDKGVSSGVFYFSNDHDRHMAFPPVPQVRADDAIDLICYALNGKGFPYSTQARHVTNATDAAHAFSAARNERFGLHPAG